MKITGLDLSLTRTGVAHAHLERETWATTCRIAPHSRLGTGHQRLQYVLTEIGNHTHGSDLILLEAIAFSRSNNAAAAGHGLWWLVAHALWRRGQPYVVVTTQQLKIYALGRASGQGENKVEKDDVLAAMIKRYPDVEIAGNDGADALALAGIGAHKLGFPLRPVPQTHSRVLEMITWPPFVEELAGQLQGLGAREEDGGEEGGASVSG